MSGRVFFREFRAADALAIRLQPSQWVEAGIIAAEIAPDDARMLEASGPAWTAVAPDGRILCCAGFVCTFCTPEGVGVQATAWAMLAKGIGSAHLAITRFARRQFAESPLARIEAIVRADDDGQACRWAELVGMKMAHVLHRWGLSSETHFLFERIR